MFSERFVTLMIRTASSGCGDLPTCRPRVRALGSFYEGPVWAQHRDAANATMIDSNNVFLLRPLDDPSRLAMDGTRPAPIHRSSEPSGAAAVTICPLDPGREGPFYGFFRSKVEPLLCASGANVRARFATERSTNNYPALPVRGHCCQTSNRVLVTRRRSIYSTPDERSPDTEPGHRRSLARRAHARAMW
jgi:hypothetical protein